MAAPDGHLSRRSFIGLSGLVGAGVLSGCSGPVIERAFRSDPNGVGSLADVDHIVLLMQENRSFDHYFGTMSSVRGFDDMSPALAQAGYGPGVAVDPAGRLMPFHLGARDLGANADILNDPSHPWTAQHASWNGGAMDAWMTTHLTSDGPLYAPEVMGYYTRADLPTHYALADAFTVCDQYFSSALGPTAPNRMYWMTGTIDPDELAGGPHGKNTSVAYLCTGGVGYDGPTGNGTPNGTGAF